MNLQWVSLRLTAALGLCAVFLPVGVHAQVSIWSNTGSGTWSWHDAGNWTGGVPVSGSSVFITNAASGTSPRIRIITNNSAIALGSINNLTLSAPSLTRNFLSLANAGSTTALRIANACTLTANGFLTITNTSLHVDGPPQAFHIDGGVSVLGNGLLVVTNSATFLGSSTNGSILVDGGTVLANGMIVGHFQESDGTLTVASGTVSNFNQLVIGSGGFDFGNNGAVWVTGGQLVVTSYTSIGDNDSVTPGVGQMTISNGTVSLRDLFVASSGAVGTLTVAGGLVALPGSFNGMIVGGNGGIGAVWQTGGQINTTNTDISIGGLFSPAFGRMTISNGTTRAARVFVGGQGDGDGALTIAGGSLIASNLTASSATVPANVTLLGLGQLALTNLIVGNQGNGQLTVSNGNVVVATSIIVGNGAGARGTMTFAGGSSTANVVAVSAQSMATGAVWITGGNLFVNAVLRPGGLGNGQLTISNGTLFAGATEVALNANTRGTFTIAGGTVTSPFALNIANVLGGTGTVWMTGGQLSVLAGPTQVGFGGAGRMIISNGVFNAATLTVAASPGSAGTLTLAGGTNRFASLTVGLFAGATGTVAVTGIQLVLTNAPTIIGSNGVGQMTISNATVQTSTIIVGNDIGSAGTLTLNGGTLITDRLVMTNLNSRLVLNSGTLETKSTVSTNVYGILVGDGTNSATLRFLGGTHSFFDDGAGNINVQSNSSLTGNGTISLLLVFNAGVIAPGDSAGRLDINGSLMVTNSSDLRFELGGYTAGTTYDLITLTNATTLRGKLSLSFINDFASTVTNGASFTVLVGHSPIAGAFANVPSGGLLATTDGFANFIVTYSGTNIVLSSLGILDSDMDGLPNWWEQKYFGTPTGANAALDTDGDGFTNLQEFLANTDPTDSASALRITAVAKESNNIRVTWMSGGSRTNILEATAGGASGSFTNNFTGIVTNFIPGTSLTTTNHLDLGGAQLTNRYYRVRLMP